MGDNETDLSSPLPWRRSLRASQARRGAQARRRRLLLRGRAGLALALGGLAVATAGALAHDTTPSAGGASAQRASSPRGDVSVEAIQRALGVKADGVMGPRTRAALRRFQRRNDLTVDGIAGPATLAALELTAQERKPERDAPAGSDATGASVREPVTAEVSATLERIAQCESGGDPTVVSADGTYRGKYQFDRETWSRLGGSGDPAAASEAEQDRRAARLLDERGTAPWPSCA